MLVVVGFLGSVTASFGQKDYSANAQQKALEVYKNCPEYSTADYLPTYKEWLSRVEVKTLAVSANDNLANLTTIPLKNKCNMDLTYQNTSFDQAKFNPLKYMLDFETTEKLTYRIDGTDKVLIIHPKK